MKIGACLCYVLLFILAVHAQRHLSKSAVLTDFIAGSAHRKFSRHKLRIATVFLMLALFALHTYFTRCEGLGVRQCFFIGTEGDNWLKDIGVAVFISLNLFLGGLHQQFYNGGMRRRLHKLQRPAFQWTLFKHMFAIPLFTECLFRGIFNRHMNPDFARNTQFIAFSAGIHCCSFLHNIVRLESRLSRGDAFKACLIQMAYNLFFSAYCTYIFVRRQSLLASIATNVFGEFIGFPEYNELLTLRNYLMVSPESAIYYLLGLSGWALSCLML